MDGLKLIKAPGEMHLFGLLIPDEYIWPEDTGYFSDIGVIDALSQMTGDIVVRVNSDGGNPVQGEAIRAAFASYPGRVHIKVEGAAHSAASLMIMSADHIEMSAGSLMLIHDPSVGVAGNPAELQAVVNDLNQMADVYASVYAARTNMTVEAARDIMRDGVTLSPSDAVELGFADSVTPAAAPGASAEMTAMHQNALAAAELAMCAGFEKRKKPGSDPKPSHDLNMAQTGDETLTKNNTPKTDVAPTPAAPAETPAVEAQSPVTMAADPVATTVAPVIDAASVLADERKRVSDIRTMAAPFAASMAAGQVDKLIDDGATVDQARVIIMNAAAAAQPRASRAEIIRDEGETQIEGMIGALMHGAAPSKHKMEGPATDYRGLRVKSLAMSLAGGQRGFDDISAVRSGLQSTTLMSGALGVSDFAYITTEVMGRLLRSEYLARNSSWRMLSEQQSATDFRELHSVFAGGDFQLKPAQENGEYLQSNITDGANGMRLAKYGRQINLSFEAIINDDMGVFNRLPGKFSRAASNLENTIAWDAIRTNPVMGESSERLFSTAHKNLSASAGAISATTVAAGRKAMFEQREPGSTDEDAFIQAEPNYLFVPPAMELQAMQFVSTITAAKQADTNPLANTMTPVVEALLGASAKGGSDSRWYLFASDFPVLMHAFLQGYETPQVETVAQMSPDGVTMNARHIFAAAPQDYRGAYRNG